MKYIVMETKLGEAIVLDERGKFLSVPNLGYEVGQRLDAVVIFGEDRRKARAIRRLAAIAACAVIVGGFGIWQTPRGTVRVQINPDVLMEVNRFGRIVGIEGLNDDGERLIEGLAVYGQNVEDVTDKLADRAIEYGYLLPDGEIYVTVASKREDWRVATENRVVIELDLHIDEPISIYVDRAPESASDYGMSDYGTSFHETSDQFLDRPSDYGKTDYDSSSDYGVTDYDSTSDYSPSDYDSSTDYGDSDYGNEK